MKVLPRSFLITHASRPDSYLARCLYSKLIWCAFYRYIASQTERHFYPSKRKHPEKVTEAFGSKHPGNGTSSSLGSEDIDEAVRQVLLNFYLAH